MPELIRHLILNFLGLALAAFGVYAAVIHYPSTAQWTIWSNAMPALTAMLVFSLSIAAVVIGLAMLLLLLWRRRRYLHRRAAFSPTHSYDRVPSRVMPNRREDDYAFEPEDPGDGAYDDHRGNPDRGYFEGDGDRYRGNGEYRDYDERRRASALR